MVAQPGVASEIFVNHILQDVSPDHLVAAMEENLFSCIRDFGKLGRVITDDPTGVTRAVVDIPLALFNSVVDAQLNPEQVEAAVERILADAKDRSVPVMWWLTPSTRPTDLEKHLQAHGFALDEDSPGMAVDLNMLNEDLPHLEGLSIQLVEDESSSRIWAKAMACGFEAPAERAEFVSNAWYDFICRIDPESMFHYTAWWNGKPVATSLLVLGGGVAGIYAVSTIPEARRQGIGAKVTLHPLLHAREMGYRAGVLEASPMGAGMYRSLGFMEYCRISSYIWRPAG